MPSPSQALGSTNNEIEQQGRAMQAKIQSIFERMARAYAQRAIDEVRAWGVLEVGKIRIRKSFPDLEAELAEVLQTFAIRSFTSAGQGAANSVGESFRIPPPLLMRLLEEKEARLTGLMETTERQVKASVSRMVQEALLETPRPSAGELARRIRTTFHGPPSTGRIDEKAEEARGHLFSSERAALIARTELVQSQHEGMVAGYAAAGVRKVQWLAYASASRWPRRHDKMKGQIREVGEKFLNETTGHTLAYPGDASAPISETANCRCTVRAVIE